MTLLDRHLEFVAALREAGLPVSLAEGLDGVRAVTALDLADREALRAGYAATLVKRQVHRSQFDRIFDLFFPAVVGTPTRAREETDGDDALDGPEELAGFREQLAEALASSAEESLTMLAREGVQRFGLIRGRGPGEQRWSSYNVMNRVAPGELVERLLRGLHAADDPSRRREIQRRSDRFGQLVEAEVSRRAAEVRGADYVARNTVRRSIDRIDFTAARRSDLEEMRREIYPLARRLATRMSKQKHDRRGTRLDFRRTVRASMQSGGVPLETRHLPRRPGRTDLVVLCDVSGSVANFAGFTLMLVFALREQFHRVRAFTFVDEIHEVTDRFTVGADPADTLAELAASAEHATLWGRTAYGRAFSRFHELYGDALTPRTNLLVLGDARSNYSDLALPVLRQMAYDARHSWWLNPEHRRHWDTGDSAAREYAAIVPMVECRNLTQLGEFIHALA
ncbi:vWA domain-containing protein [Nocardioides terrisoli]|uniref:vWA domain-containing protein n=1 Tax=Nocardioides terrisoli TaxID=3388267 RepID=UPI00287BC221|nr:VWA domain-containing protein [Nocardioides marmorisolisilvae]